MFWVYHDKHFYDKVRSQNSQPKQIREALEIRKIKQITHFEKELDTHFKRKHASNVYRKQSSKKDLKRIFYAFEIMSKNLLTLLPSSSINEALKLVKDKHIHHIPILNEANHIVGILSDRDLYRSIKSVVVDEVMSKHVILCEKNTPIRRVAEMMYYKRIGALPVMDDTYNLCGIITRSDILKAIIQFGDIELWL